jgi:hypothetical protein
MGADCERHDPAALPPEKVQVPTLQEAGWAPGPVWTGGPQGRSGRVRRTEDFFHRAGVRTTNYPGSNESPYQLRYPDTI